ncbi:MAG: Gfo/Idh/MocA family oxidoreductase [Actinomycetota bacterium]
MVDVAVVGTGGMGTFHARTLAQLPDVRVAAVADLDPRAAARAADVVAGLRGVAPEIMTGPGAAERLATATSIRGRHLDAVVIASPDDTHAALSLAALDVGAAVLCEKPLATSVDDARRVVDAEVRAGRRSLQLGFMRQYDVPHRLVAEALAGLGAVHLVRAAHRNTSSPERDDATVVGQSVVHDIHSVRFLTGAEIVAVTARATRTASGSIRHVVVLAELVGGRAADGATATIEFDDAGFAYETTVVVTAEDGLVATPPPTRAVVGRDGAVRSDIGGDWFSWFADAYRTQDASWIDTVRAQRPPTGPSAWDGLVAQTVVDATLASLDSGGERVAVTIDEPPSIHARDVTDLGL